MSRWVKVVAIVMAVLAMLVGVMLLVGGGPGGHQIPEHGPQWGDSEMLQIARYLR